MLQIKTNADMTIKYQLYLKHTKNFEGILNLFKISLTLYQPSSTEATTLKFFAKYICHEALEKEVKSQFPMILPIHLSKNWIQYPFELQTSKKRKTQKFISMMKICYMVYNTRNDRFTMKRNSLFVLLLFIYGSETSTIASTEKL